MTSALPAPAYSQSANAQVVTLKTLPYPLADSGSVNKRGLFVNRILVTRGVVGSAENGDIKPAWVGGGLPAPNPQGERVGRV